jgi:hypothetical protein
MIIMINNILKNKTKRRVAGDNMAVKGLVDAIAAMQHYIRLT